MGSTRSKGAIDGSRPARTVALVGPSGTGKTSLAEALLFASGQINRQGSVAAGSTVGDSSPEARSRGSSTEINIMSFESAGDHFDLIDIPGSPAFAADGLAALPTADIAIVVVDPAPERAILSEPFLRQLDELGIPHAIFINKIENVRAGAIRELVAELQPLSREPLLLRQIPIRDGDTITGYVDLALERAYRYRAGGESEAIPIPGDIVPREREDRTNLLETLADFDDALLETLLRDETPETVAIMHDLAEDTACNRLVPVVFGSALTDGGVHRLLKFLRHETPSMENAAARWHAEDGGFAVFKILYAGAMGRLAVGRVFGAGLREGDELSVAGVAARAGTLFRMQGEKAGKCDNAAPGEIIAMAKMEAAEPGMLLVPKGGTSGKGLCVARPRRNAALAIKPRDHKDDARLSQALHRLCEEDPALQWVQDDTVRQTILRGINDEHLAIACERLGKRHGIAIEAEAPRISYRESVRKSQTQRGRHKKQSGGHGQFADCVIEIKPLERGAGIQFSDHITGGAIPRQYIPAIEAGVRDACASGPLGFPVVDVAITLTDGSFHTVDSSDLAFRIAGRLAMHEALAQAGPYLLEPVVRITVDAPAGAGSRTSSVLSSRRGQILGHAP
ncbi:MAG: elongation factor G, partial [Novosphingobium sp.]